MICQNKIYLKPLLINDNLKMAYAINNGYKFIVIPYGCKDKESISYIINGLINVT